MVIVSSANAMKEEKKTTLINAIKTAQ